jgi:hypothetical protein
MTVTVLPATTMRRQVALELLTDRAAPAATSRVGLAQLLQELAGAYRVAELLGRNLVIFQQVAAMTPWWDLPGRRRLQRKVLTLLLLLGLQRDRIRVLERRIARTTFVLRVA